MHPMPPLFPLAAIIVIALAQRKRHKIVDAFRRSSATAPERAKSLTDLGMSNSFLFGNEVQQHVIVSPQESLYYLDENRLETVTHLRRRIAFVLGVCLFIAALILFLAN